MVVESLDYAIQVGGCGQNHKDMEDLMGTAPNVKTAGIPAFWEPDLVFTLVRNRQ